MDTSDAMLSWREREARLRILKDVHVGAFAVIALTLLVLFQFAASLSVRTLFPLLFLPVLSRSGSAQTTVGKGLEFDVITCVVLGGVSVNGGVGRISGVIAGVLIIGSLTNGMILLNVSEYIQMVVKGLVLAAAVGLDCMSNKRKTN